MNFEDSKVINNEDLIIMYPRRTLKENDYEIWQFPYVFDNVVSLDTDLVFVHFGNRNKITHLAVNEERTKDLDHLSRIELLVHDLNEEFDYESYVFNDHNSDQAIAFIESLISSK